MNKEEFLSMVDHTILKADAMEEDVKKVIQFAKENKCASVCINPYYVKLAKEMLKETDVKVCTVIGFPLGQNTTKVKVYEAKSAAEDGADEIDMVINVAALKDKKYDYVYDEIKKIKDATDKLLKVIIENAYLTSEERKVVCEICVKAKVDFVKTSTGFAKTGAIVSEVREMKEVVKDMAKIKAAGGISKMSDVIDLYNAGAVRFGLSRTESILKEFEEEI